MTIRPVVKTDIEGIKKVLTTSGLFPAELLGEMIQGYLNAQASPEFWFVAKKHDSILGFGFCAPEQLTEGTYNLYAIAVDKAQQGHGIGKSMMHYIEAELKAKGHRILIVETSGKPDFAQTRKFYDQCGYIEQAVIPDFYEEGDDKIVFWKKLAVMK